MLVETDAAPGPDKRSVDVEDPDKDEATGLEAVEAVVDEGCSKIEASVKDPGD